MKVSKHFSLDLEVVQELERLNKDKNFSPSQTINSYLRYFFELDKENKLEELKKEKIQEEIDGVFKDA